MRRWEGLLLLQQGLSSCKALRLRGWVGLLLLQQGLSSCRALRLKWWVGLILIQKRIELLPEHFIGFYDPIQKAKSVNESNTCSGWNSIFVQKTNHNPPPRQRCGIFVRDVRCLKACAPAGALCTAPAGAGGLKGNPCLQQGYCPCRGMFTQ